MLLLMKIDEVSSGANCWCCCCWSGVDEGSSMKHKIQSVQHFGAEHLGDSSYYGAVL